MIRCIALQGQRIKNNKIMKLSIITINYNNALGLKKTMENVLSQTSKDFEYIIVDGGSNDSSLQVISNQLSLIGEEKNGEVVKNDIIVKWISEPDNGIYHALNKGIQMAKGDYVQILNSSDWLVNVEVTKTMLQKLDAKLEVQILYGNMLKVMPDKRILHDASFAGKEITMLDMYTGTLNHSPVYIKRSLFDTFGLYDEELKYVSDWKWYVKAIIMGGVKPQYVNIDVIYFDMAGVSTSNWDKTLQEKRTEMDKLFPATILKDYDQWAFPIDQMKRLQRHPWAYKSVWFLERLLFKWEKMKAH